MSSALRTIELAVGYPAKRSRTVVLEGLNLSVRAGEMVCLAGPNGIGKSTLLRTISKIQPPLAGSVEINGIDLSRLNQMALARSLGVVLTERPLAGALPAHRLVELGRYPHLNWLGQLGPHDHDVVAWAIDAVSASHLASRDSSKLSDGERQRFMIARALAQEPSILLLDEPTAFLDVPSRVELMGLLRRLVREEELAIVVSTHDLELALRMADTLWLVAPGGRFYAGAPEDLILAGRVAETFPAETVRFHPDERAFRPVTSPRERAIVEGGGLHALLAAAVLEREGFKVVTDEASALRIKIGSESAHWEAVVGETRGSGENFAALAEFVRVRPPTNS
jgi:iron complex transport system ATP-binding protein